MLHVLLFGGKLGLITLGIFLIISNIISSFVVNYRDLPKCG